MAKEKYELVDVISKRTKKKGHRFVKGQSGNPRGRPKGIPDKRSRLRAMMEPHAPALVNRVIQRAMAGDMQAAKLCFERLIPTLRPMTEPIQSCVPHEKDMSVQATTIFDKVLHGELTTDEATALINILVARMSIETATDLERRLAEMEKQVEEDRDEEE